MKKLMSTLLTASILTFVCSDYLGAQDNGDSQLNVVYRDPEGKLSKDSKNFARILARKAHANGTVALWVTLNYPFNTNIGEMSQSELDAQNTAVRDGFDELLEPLIARRLVSHPNNVPVVFGNGCRVLANSAGVRALVSDKRVLHLIETRVE